MQQQPWLGLVSVHIPEHGRPRIHLYNFTISRRPSAEVPRHMTLMVPFSCAMHNRGVEPVDMGAEAPPCSGHRQAWPQGGEQWELPVVQIAQWKPGSIFSRLRLPMNLPMGFTRARL